MAEARTMTASLVERVQTDIVDGVLAPGSRLKLNGLGERYSAGLIPLREALSRLANSGFVLSEDQKGFSVAPVSREDLLDVTRTRIEIECLALRRSLERSDVEWEARVLAAAHRLSRLVLWEDESKRTATAGWHQAHGQFHRALVSACDSPRLLQYREQLSDQTQRYRRLSGVYACKPRPIDDEHDAILAAALDHDAERLCDLTASHFSETAEIILECFDWGR